MPSELEQITDALRAGALAEAPVLARGHQGVVRALTVAGRDWVVKEATGRGLVGRANRWSLVREARAYRRLDGLDGVAGFAGWIDARWLVLEHVVGAPFRHADPDGRYFEALLATLRGMHARGVAHADLKRKDNLLVDPAGLPVILDFGAAVVRRAGFHPVNHRLFEFLRQTDLNAWVKLKHGRYDARMPVADRALLRRGRLERLLSRTRSRTR